MQKITSAYAIKMLRGLEEDKAFWVNKEAASSTCVAAVNHCPYENSIAFAPSFPKYQQSVSQYFSFSLQSFPSTSFIVPFFLLIFVYNVFVDLCLCEDRRWKESRATFPYKRLPIIGMYQNGGLINTAPKDDRSPARPVLGVHGQFQKMQKSLLIHAKSIQTIECTLCEHSIVMNQMKTRYTRCPDENGT